MSGPDLSNMSMLELFRLDAESQFQALTGGLLALERDPVAAEQLEICMRAAHSLKGAARIIGLDVAVKITHAMEDCFVAAQRSALRLRQSHIDVLLRGIDLLTRIVGTAEAELAVWSADKAAEVTGFLADLAAAVAAVADTPAPVPEVAPAPVAAQPVQASESDPPPVSAPPAVVATPEADAAPRAATAPEVRTRSTTEERENANRVLRVTAENLNRLLGLAGESLVESRWLKPYAQSLLRLKRMHDDAATRLDDLREMLASTSGSPQIQALLSEARSQVQECHQLLSQRLIEIEMFDGRSTNLVHRLYDAVLACRMRPFADGVRTLPRTVRDLGRSLGKQIRLEILGEDTQVDRDILEKLDAPMGHLLRNAIDHGIEPPRDRVAVGKPEEGVLRIEARHSAGLLQITIADDGRGVDLDRLREAIVERKLTTTEVAQRLSEAEVLEFLFLPGFSMKETVTEISGRGVGLDVVQTMIRQVRGSIRISSQPGKGTCFQLQLPLTLSVMRTLLVEIGGEPYAFPLAHIVRTLKVPRDAVEVLEGRQHFRLDGKPVGLVSAQQVLGGDAPKSDCDELSVLIVGDPGNTYGLITDRFLGERELVVQPLDPRFGKIKDIAAGALMEDGLPVLIVDVEDMLCSIEKIVSGGRLHRIERGSETSVGKSRKRVLVVDDSLTVRELERKLLDHAAYEVEVAVDGMDGWNAVRAGSFDLVVTDIDMPRMDGIELVARIKRDPDLKSIPVMIVSYKDREEDRRRGLDAGADYYLTKASFHDETLLHAVEDLIGAAIA
jgi:two-component system sensor histidine kinase and response regulator WspE